MFLEKLTETFKKVLERLKETYSKAENLNESDYLISRDGSIQRFEFTVEIFWKCIKTYLKGKEGMEYRSPNSCIQEFFSVGYLNKQKIVLLLK